MVYFWMDELLSKAAREGLIDPARPEALWKMQVCGALVSVLHAIPERNTGGRMDLGLVGSGLASDTAHLLWCSVLPSLF